MEKKGLLYEGLPMPSAEERCMDLTYFIAYSLSQNPCCREAFTHMEKGRRRMLLKRARNSPYTSPEFFKERGLSGWELVCCRCVIGLLQELRFGKQEQKTLANVGFWYVVCRGFHKEYETWKEWKLHLDSVRLSTAAFFMQDYKEKGLKLCSWLCINLVIAEKLGVIFIKDEGYRLFCLHLQKYDKILG